VEPFPSALLALATPPKATERTADDRTVSCAVPLDVLHLL